MYDPRNELGAEEREAKQDPLNVVRLLALASAAAAAGLALVLLA